MTYSGDTPVVVTSDPAGALTLVSGMPHPNSPHYKNSETPTFQTSTPGGPGGHVKKSHAAGSGAAYTSTAGAQPAFHAAHSTPRHAGGLRCFLSRRAPDRSHESAGDPHLHLSVSNQGDHSGRTRPLQVDITPDGSTAIVTSFDNALNSSI